MRTAFAALAASLLSSAALAQFDASVTLEDGAYEIRWSSGEPLDVFMSMDPDSPPAEARLISDDDVDGAHRIRRTDAESRAYFILQDAEGRTERTALRLLPLEGGRNFRDLGGYATEDGRTVRWGRVYRSGVMHELTEADYRYLTGLGIGVVCDFRSASEREDEPTSWAAGEIDYVAWDYELDTSGFAEAFSGEMSAERSAEIFKGFYRQTPYTFADRYAVMFDRLAAGEIPLAFNCSAGKDRTGVAAALILSALGVPRDTVVADYALSDDYVDYMAELAADRERMGDIDPSDPMYVWTQLPPEVIAPFMASDPAYIEASFDQIEADHGDVATYLREVLDVTDAELVAIREALLER